MGVANFFFSSIVAGLVVTLLIYFIGRVGKWWGGRRCLGLHQLLSVGS